MKFEYDKNKSDSNKIKHGIDFQEAQILWNDPYAIELPSLNSDEEIRFLVIAQMNNRCYTSIITYRGDAIRIISVRRSREKEIELYENIKNR